MSLRKAVEGRIYRHKERLSELDAELADLQLKRRVSILLCGEFEAMINELAATALQPSDDVGNADATVNP